jgi:hypothetical protein
MSRSILLAIAVAATGLGACVPGYEEPVLPRDAMRFDAELVGLAPGKPQSCLPPRSSANVVAARGRTLLFRDGPTVYANETSGGCSALADRHYTMVTESFGGDDGLCRGSWVKVVDLRAAGSLRGSCVLGDFTPFRRPRP